jgi:hypothetical protein
MPGPYRSTIRNDARKCLNGKFVALVLCALISVSDSGVALAKNARWCGQVFHTGPSGYAAISGKLIKRSDFGPPNFGEHPETDQKVVIWVVHLDFPIPVEVNRELKMAPKVVHVSDIQIGFSSKVDPILPKYRNRHVRVEGRFWTQVNWQDYTPVVIAGDTIRVAGKTDCHGKEVGAPI